VFVYAATSHLFGPAGKFSRKVSQTLCHWKTPERRIAWISCNQYDSMAERELVRQKRQWHPLLYESRKMMEEKSYKGK
jgi:hypothetical protein